MDDITATACRCGAVEVERNLETYWVPYRMYLRLFDGLAINQIVQSECGQCRDGIGVTLCGCGSGQQYRECLAGLSACSSTAQSLEDLKAIAISRNLQRFLQEVLSE